MLFKNVSYLNDNKVFRITFNREGLVKVVVVIIRMMGYS